MNTKRIHGANARNKPITIKVSSAIAAHLNAQPNRSEYIRAAIAEKMERERADRRANLDSALADICR